MMREKWESRESHCFEYPVAIKSHEGVEKPEF